jgi:type I restriction enzyme S subunit
LINRNLETLAKQFYDYWFVQFDYPNENGRPYKSSGGKMVWNENVKREIPEGWSVAKIGEIAQTFSGGTPKSTNVEYYENGSIPWINSGELNQPIITSTPNRITQLGLDNSSAKLYPINTVLIAMYGATAGKISLLTFPACSNQAVCGVIPTKKHSLAYIFYALTSMYERFVTLSTGSARDNISQITIKSTELIIPHETVLIKYDCIANKIIQRMIDCQKEIEMLIKQRDELLPLLMNGQVSVNSDL